MGLLFLFVGPMAIAEPTEDPSNDSNPAENGAVVAQSVYLDGANGSDENDGSDSDHAVKTFAKAKTVAQANHAISEIKVIGTTPIEGDVNLTDINVPVVRGEGFNAYLFQVAQNTSATLTNITVDGKSEENNSIDKSLISVESGATLTIDKNAVLRNNKIPNNVNRTGFGGAVNANHATVTMTDGTVEDNQANYGGGIYLYKSTMNLSGGVIQGNTAKRLNDTTVSPTQYYSAGGGICADGESTLNMSGTAIVQKNHADETGGGISIGSNQWGPTNTFNMEGGEVKDNTSGGTGGGIFIQAKYFSGGASKGYINAGKITGNKMLGTGYTETNFGGGGIYVNGAANSYGVNGANGELYIKNAIITGNESALEGAGYAGCPISKTTVHVTNGVSLQGNTRSIGALKAKDFYLLSSDAYGLHAGQAKYKLAKRMLGGVPYSWQLSDGDFLPNERHEGTLPHKSELALYTKASANELTNKLARVIISGNSSATRGGGIGSNGTVIFGTTDETVDLSVSKKWEDKDDAAKARPASITVHLIAKIGEISGEVETRTLSEENDWQVTFSDLPKTQGDQEIAYSITEDEIEGYKSEISGSAADGYVITNTYTPEPEPSTTPTEPASTQPTTQPTSPEGLSKTGVNAYTWSGVAAGLALVGAMLSIVATRRRDS